eukprot:m.31934 g.31934  ORF g.31934 m.31934 type:complete len:325 (-) comp8362_c0_seq1:185-1159(-)
MDRENGRQGGRRGGRGRGRGRGGRGPKPGDVPKDMEASFKKFAEVKSVEMPDQEKREEILVTLKPNHTPTDELVAKIKSFQCCVAVKGDGFTSNQGELYGGVLFGNEARLYNIDSHDYLNKHLHKDGFRGCGIGIFERYRRPQQHVATDDELPDMQRLNLQDHDEFYIVLVGKDKKSNTPGGLIEKGETFEDGAIREAFEETAFPELEPSANPQLIELETSPEFKHKLKTVIGCKVPVENRTFKIIIDKGVGSPDSDKIEVPDSAKDEGITKIARINMQLFEKHVENHGDKENFDKTHQKIKDGMGLFGDEVKLYVNEYKKDLG